MLANKCQLKVIQRFLVILTGLFIAYLLLITPPLLSDISFSRVVLDRNGQLMRISLSEDDKYRLYAPISQIPTQLKQAVLLYEDRYFYQHFGVNPLSLLKAFIATYFTNNRRMGGSTITMQLARLKFGINSSNLLGKLEQIIKAIQLEIHYSKDEILESYLNLAPYGGNIEGVKAASLIYFNHNLDNLNLLDSLSLAVIPQNPLKRSPKFSQVKKAELARKKLFISWIEKNPQNKIYEQLFNLPIVFQNNLPFIAPHFTLNLLAKAKEEQIHSTLDKNLQIIIERQIKTYVQALKEYGVNNASALLIDFTSMEVIASVGSADFYDNNIDGQVNGTKAKRSPGSTLKPFIYALSFDQGLIHPLTLLKDAPDQYGNYMPENLDGNFIGPISARESLIKSRNVPVLYLTSKLTKPDFYQFLSRAQITKLRKHETYGLSIALGSLELNMEELARLYAMLANLGEYRQLKTIIAENNNHSDNNRLLSKEACYLILDILKEVPRPGLNYNLASKNNPNLPIYWKTGTSSGYKDSWAIGIFGKYVLAVWVGNFKGTSKGSFIGFKTAAPLFFNIIDSISVKLNIKDILLEKSKNLNLIKLEACADTGDINNSLCPVKTETWFIPGVSPIKSTDIYRKILVDNKTGKQICKYNSNTTHYKIVEFWPTDLSILYKKAGISKASPPILSKNCKDFANLAKKPEITSPLKDIIYTLTKESKIIFKATVDSEVTEIFWFVNQQLVGKSLPSENFLWNAKAGKFIVQAVDNYGRSSSRVMIIEH